MTSGLYLTLWALAAGRGERVLVVPAAVQGEPAADPRLAAELAASLNAIPNAEAAALVVERLPPVLGAAKAEPVMEADHMVQRGRDAYLDGRFDEAASQLARAREVLQRAVDSFDEE